MNTQKVSSLEGSAAGKPWPLVEGCDAAAKLNQKRFNYRCFEVVTPEGSCVVEYRAEGMGNERVLVDGQVAAHGHSTWWYTPHFQFHIGSADAVLAVRFAPWLTIRWLKLIVGGQVVYSEGSAGLELSADELLKVLSDPLASEGIQVEGGSVPVPTNVVCEKQGPHVTLTQRWFSWTSVVMVPFCVLLDAAVVGVHALMPKGDLALLTLLAMLPGILLALSASYYVLARLVNRTVVRVTASGLSIQHGPLPWLGNRSLPIQHVKEFICEQRASRDYAGDVWETYTLSAIREDGRQVELVHKIGTSGAVHVLKQQVIAWLAAAQQAGSVVAAKNVDGLSAGLARSV